MFWIEESPTNAQDDDSDVPFDECPGQPMACEQEIELVFKPDDDLYPLKSSSSSSSVEDADTWPETLSANGTNNTQDGSTDEDQSTVRDQHNDAEPSLETIQDNDDDDDDDDATQVMGEHHTTEDERTFESSIQDRSFVYQVKSADIATATAAEESVLVVNDPVNVEPQEDDQQVNATTITTPESSSSLSQQEQHDAGTTFAPLVVEQDEESSSSSSSPPSLVNEPKEEPALDPVVVDDAEHDLAAADAASISPSKSLHEMNHDLQEEDKVEEEKDPNWYDQWQPLEETDDGISCISNMFAPIDTVVSRAPLPITESLEILSNPTMTTVFSDGAEVSQIANVDQLLPLMAAQEEAPVTPQEATLLSTTTSSSASASQEASTPEDEQEEKEPCTIMNGPKVVLIFEGEDDNMTLTEFLNANCLQGTRKERRLRIMERQRNALSRIQPMPASVAPTDATGGGPGFFDQLLDFENNPIMEQLQNMGADLFG